MKSRSRTAISENCVLMRSRLLYLLGNFHFQFQPAQLVFLLCKVTCIILNSMSLFGVAQQFFFFINYFWKLHIQPKRVLSVPAAFQVSDWLHKSSYSLLIPTPIYWHSRSCQTFHHGLQVEWSIWWFFTFKTFRTFALSQLKHGAEVCWNARVTAVAVFTLSN